MIPWSIAVRMGSEDQLSSSKSSGISGSTVARMSSGRRYSVSAQAPLKNPG